MKQINFNYPGGFPLEQETLKRLQTAYRHELYEALKAHLGIETNKNYIISDANEASLGWLVIHQELPDFEHGTGLTKTQGILYPLKKTDIGVTDYIKTTRTASELTFGDGNDNTVYADYEAEYINWEDYAEVIETGIPLNSIIKYYNLASFTRITTIKTISSKIDAIEVELKRLDASVLTKADKTYVDALINQINVKIKQFGDDIQDLKTTKAEKTEVNSLIKRIEDLEKRPQGTVPVGLIAVWGRPANEIPRGWKEYTPLRGRMPVGLDINYSSVGDSIIYNLQTLGFEGGKKEHKLTKAEMPIHSHGVAEYAGSGGEYHINSGVNYEGGGGISAPEGGDKPHTNMPPYRVVYFIEYIGGTVTVANKTVNLASGQTVSGEIVLTAEADTSVTSYQWTKGDGTTLPTGVIANQSTLTLSGLTEGIHTYKVNATIAAGTIISGTATVTVKKNQAPLIESIYTNLSHDFDNDIYLASNRFAKFTATISDTDMDNLTYTWTQVSGPNIATLTTDGVLTPSNKNVNLFISNLILQPDQLPYVFKLTVTDSFGNTTAKEIKVRVGRTITTKQTNLPNEYGYSEYEILITGVANETVTINTSLDINSDYATSNGRMEIYDNSTLIYQLSVDTESLPSLPHPSIKDIVLESNGQKRLTCKLYISGSNYNNKLSIQEQNLIVPIEDPNTDYYINLNGSLSIDQSHTYVYATYRSNLIPV